MNKKEYLERLKSELKGFSYQEMDMFVEEVEDHIEEGQADNLLGDDVQARNQKLLDEMGSPNELGRRLKEVHRPKRWIDFLLVFIPSEIIMTLILILLTILLGDLAPINSSYDSKPYLMATIRISFILKILMAIIARHRRSASLLLYWLPQAVLTTFSLLFHEKRWELQSPFNNNQIGIIESLFWLIILVFLVYWLVYTLSANRRNPLMIVLAIIPFFIMFGNMSRNSYISTASFPNGYVLPNLNITHVLGFPIGLYQISEFLWPLFFYVFRNKQVRWIGLFFYAIPISMMNLVASIRYPRLIIIWLVPSLIVIVGWLIDIIRRTRQPHVVTW